MTITNVVDTTVINDANAILTVLASNAENFTAVAATTLTDAEQETAFKKLDHTLNKLGKGALDVVGARAFGTATAASSAGVYGEAGQQAIRMLKENDRIQQCGKGRGKCIIIIDSTPLPAAPEQVISATATENTDETIEEPADPDEEEVLSVPVLLRKARDEYRKTERGLKSSEREVTRLRKTIEEKDQEIVELKEQLHNHAAFSWQ